MGTEFGAYVTLDGGARWFKMTGGVPTIAVRDFAIQKRERDLVIGTFGRGFYVLDDYTALRGLTRTTLEQPAVLFGTRTALAFIEKQQLGGRGKASLGDAFYTADNPPFGAVFTYYLKDELRKTRKDLRHDREKQAEKDGKVAAYPSKDELRAEAWEAKPAVVPPSPTATGTSCAVSRARSRRASTGWRGTCGSLPPPRPRRTARRRTPGTSRTRDRSWCQGRST